MVLSLFKKFILTDLQAYISVDYDEQRATVTASQRSVPKLEQQLRAAGATVTEIGLRGRFHYQGYQDDLEGLLTLCDSNSQFRFPDARSLILPTRSNPGEDKIATGSLHRVALQAILVEQSKWYQTFATVQSLRLVDRKDRVISFGPERCIPPSMMRKLNSRIIHFGDLHGTVTSGADNTSYSQSPPSPNSFRSADEIAVIGMSCNVAGADDLEGFWKILINGRSQHKEVPPDRFGFETVFREAESKGKWYGNFINNPDAFDHKFFKKTPREAASTDPQQRLLMQVAYQAVEQSGYFQSSKWDLDKHIGCYIGVCATDYENNIACHAPNAFSATGNLRSFIAGKISHYFGWTGPGLTIDTACSASAVAIHQACTAILSGECTAALAGGTNMMTQPLWYQNLAAGESYFIPQEAMLTLKFTPASFLSPTGQCKPFDVKADGYCRGEAIATVFLKRMSSAIADGDQILGTIAGTAVYQNQNCTPIFVPNAPSLSDLFRKVIHKSQLEVKQISVVEAHGTGTAVGDPAEYDSIRQVFGGLSRSKNLQLGSVKGLVGHTEGTSGVVSLIKVLLMIQEGYIPPQASFSAVNPAIRASPSDKITISTSLQPWDEDYRSALINNYGASGSNASLIVTQAPPLRSKGSREALTETSLGDIRYPFWLSGLDERSIRAYSTRLRQFLRSDIIFKKNISVENLAFNISRQSNRSLDRALIFSCQSIDELEQKLVAFESGESAVSSVVQPTPRPVILCFGGQISTFVGLDRHVYDNVKILRSHLDECDSVCRSLGVGSVYPGIFQKEPVSDPVKLQTMLFAIQYASASSWIDSGIQPSAVIGHSFGELTALCISGVLSLHDALKMIVGRSTIIRDSWGSDKGTMLAVEANPEEVERLLEDSRCLCNGTPATIACVNGPRSFTLAGPTQSIDAVAQTISSNTRYLSMLSKRLNVTNAYHSPVVDPLMADLERLGQSITFNEPKIQLERATEFSTVMKPGPTFVARHMRDPVYFNHAVQRLYKQFPSSIWLEASSNATITTMASRALGSPKNCYFQPVIINSGYPMQQLIDTTLSLWKAGLKVQYWAHSHQQTYDYTPLILPPYQFDRPRHWMELKKPPKLAAADQQTQEQIQPKEEVPTTLCTFMGYQDSKQIHSRFRINTTIQKYKDIVSGHVIAQTAPICPATLQVDMAVEALMSLQPKLNTRDCLPQVCDVINKAPVCNDASRSVWLDFEALEDDSLAWLWKITSKSQQSTAVTTHVTGRIAFRPVADSQYQLEFSRYERLVDHQRCLRALEGNDADDVVQGRSIYKIFKPVVDYGEMYFGLRKLVGKGNESAGLVIKKRSGETWLDPFLGDCFSQVGGIWVNCMTENIAGEMYIANGFEQWTRSPKLAQDDKYSSLERWHVLAHHEHTASGNAYLTDIFVFDSITGTLTEVILGINYVKVPTATMSKLLSRLTIDESTKPEVLNDSPSLPLSMQEPETSHAPPLLSHSSQEAKVPKLGNGMASSPGQENAKKLKLVLADISGLELGEISDDVELADIGIDSLLGMEMAREIEGVFKCTLSTDELMHVTNFPSLLRCLHSALGVVENESSHADLGEDSTSDDRRSFESQNDCPTPDSTNVTSLASSSASSTVMEASKGASTSLDLPSSTVLEAFGESKKLTDSFIENHRCSGYLENVMPKQSQLCIALTVEAFKHLGCNLYAAKADQLLDRIAHVPEHARMVEYLYKMLEETRIIDLDGSHITRTAVALPSQSSDKILDDLDRNYPDHVFANQLSYWTGSKLADVLTGKADGIKLIFADNRGRELVSGLYGDSLLNKLAYKQMEDFLTRLVSKLPRHEGPLKILEMGAGTGGTTKWLVPLLASLRIPLEYTFTDLSSSFVVGARKKFKDYPFMKFRVHDIEQPPAENELYQSQHIVIASNAVHATHSLAISARNIHKFLRPDGFLMMLEMTETLCWVDMIFGVLEGWWLFDDGRRHAIAHESRWEQELQAAGYGHVDWTDGSCPEVHIQRIFIALASGPRIDRLPPAQTPAKSQFSNSEARRAATEEQIHRGVSGFSVPAILKKPLASSTTTVLVTGATGSLGSHLVAYFAQMPDVGSVICLNRRNSTEATLRQQQAFETKGITLDHQAFSKLKVFEADVAKPLLGLPQDQYDGLCNEVTHIVHNAWPMSGKLPFKGFALQFQAMRNLIDLARDIAVRQASELRVGFQLVSSIATVGYHPLWTGNAHVPEEKMTIQSVLPNGYGDAKFVCERMLDETLHKYPTLFRTMVVRLGQIAGSRTSGYWNHMEHFSFIVKSAQTLKALPDFEGLLSWTPVNDVAATMSDLLLSDTDPYPFYHIDNPVRQPWREMTPILADALQIPRERIIPFPEWIRRVKAFPGLVEWENPAAKLVDFLDDDFVRMSCGGVLMDTEKTWEHSQAIRKVGPVEADVVRRYIRAWKETGFLV